MTESQIEREQIAWVFGLTGGELADETWNHAEWHAYDDHDAFAPAPSWCFAGPLAGGMCWGSTVYRTRDWYEFAPEYAQQDLERLHGWDSQFRTIVVCGGGYLPEPAFALRDEDGTQWALVACYTNSGETECPDRGQRVAGTMTLDADGDEHWTGEPCPLCEAEPGEEHGYIYVGEGYEAVYMRVASIEEMED